MLFSDPAGITHVCIYKSCCVGSFCSCLTLNERNKKMNRRFNELTRKLSAFSSGRPIQHPFARFWVSNAWIVWHLILNECLILGENVQNELQSLANARSIWSQIGAYDLKMSKITTSFLMTDRKSPVNERYFFLHRSSRKWIKCPCNNIKSCVDDQRKQTIQYKL